MSDSAEKKKITYKCPDCENDFEIDTDSMAVGDITECSICGTTLEVANLSPFTLEPVTTFK